jgi:hypothetical protein
MMARRRGGLLDAFLQASGGQGGVGRQRAKVEAERQQVLAEVVMQVAGDAAAFGVAQDAGWRPAADLAGARRQRLRGLRALAPPQQQAGGAQQHMMAAVTISISSSGGAYLMVYLPVMANKPP